jgi:titin
MRAINGVGSGPVSSIIPAMAGDLSYAPTIISITSSDSSLSINFTPQINIGTIAITDYQYTINGGTNWNNIGLTTNPFNITGLTNGITYDVQMRVINGVGSGPSSSIVSAMPGTSPSEPTITSITSGSEFLSVNFTPPINNGGVTITDYQYTINDGIDWNNIGLENIVNNTFNIMDVTNGTTYNVQMRAINGVGSGPSSSIVSAMPGTPPSAPTILSIIPDDSSLSVNFTPPTNNGGVTITDYQYTINDGIDWNNIGLENIVNNSFNLMNLTNGTTYDVQMRAVNTSGFGIGSNTVNSIVGVTLAPELTLVTSIDTGLRISFTQPSNYITIIDGISQYYYSIDNGVTYNPSGQLSSPITISDLTNGTEYVITLKGESSNGLSLASNALSGTPSTMPSAPTITTIIFSIADLSLTVNFSPPADNGGAPITNYTYSIDNGENYNILSPASTISPIVINEIYPNRTYIITIAAINQRGTGIVSEPYEITPTA